MITNIINVIFFVQMAVCESDIFQRSDNCLGIISCHRFLPNILTDLVTFVVF